MIGKNKKILKRKEGALKNLTLVIKIKAKKKSRKYLWCNKVNVTPIKVACELF